MEKFTLFWNGPFSQWYRSTFEIDGMKFNCCEQYMMYKKAMLMGDRETAHKIMDIGYDPREHKALGRQVKPFSATKWNQHCRQIVYEANYAKFSQNPKLLEELKGTIGTTLVEASPYDKIWGIGLAESDPRALSRETWRGTNWLGEEITKVRVALLGE